MTEITYRSDMTVELIDHMGNDHTVVAAARVSTLGSETHGEGGTGLINYLMRDRHGSPFEHVVFTFRIETPIFVVRELMRHRIASYNEESGRYKQLDPVFYVPDEDRKLVQVGKPGAYEFVEGTEKQQRLVKFALKGVTGWAYGEYLEMLKYDVAREVARMALPLNIYTSLYMTVNARSLMNFLSLRTKREDSTYPSFPQREIEMVAEKMEEIFAARCPDTYAAFNKNGRVAP